MLRPAQRDAATQQIVRRRLEAHGLAAPALERPADVVARLGAVQAQDYLGALWAIGARLSNAHERDVENALADRSIVRSWPMRGTLHFVAARDARWLIELLAPRVQAAGRKRLLALGIDEELLGRARHILVRHLEGGRQLTRPGLYRALERGGVPTHGGRGLHVIWCLAQERLVCFGARQGKQQTFVLFEEWLPKAQRKRLARDEALAELAHRYFSAHGPATLRDFAWWSGMTLGEARQAAEMAGSRLEEERILGESYRFAASTPALCSGGGSGRSGERAHALPAFDEFFVGYADRSAALLAGQEPPSAFALLGPVTLLDGRWMGTWKRRIAGRRLILSMRPARPLSKTQAAHVQRALSRYASFVEMAPELELFSELPASAAR